MVYKPKTNKGCSLVNPVRGKIKNSTYIFQSFFNSEFPLNLRFLAGSALGTFLKLLLQLQQLSVMINYFFSSDSTKKILRDICSENLQFAHVF